MYVIDVIPIAKGMGKEHLSYFTSRSVTPGALVSVPLRKKTVIGIVITVATAAERKTDIKSSQYTIRKVEKLQSTSFLDSGVVEAAHETARYFATTPGRVLQAVIPNAILEDTSSLKKPHKQAESDDVHEKFLLQTQPEERLAHYKSLVREDFAKQRSVFFCLPTIEDINKAREGLEKGIEQYTYVLHGNLTKKEIRRIWNEIISHDHAVLIIATPIFLSLPRRDLGTIIIERETASSYKLQAAPFCDMRTYAEFLSRARGVRFVLGDTLLRVETLWRYRNLEFAEYMPIKHRSLTSAATSLIPMREEQTSSEKDEFPILSNELKERINQTYEHNERMFLFTSRRGLAPITVCADCGSPALCEHCENPVVLHEHKTDEQKNTFLCHKCGTKRSAHETCRTCKSWRLRALGIGAERVAQEVARYEPNCSVFIIDKDHTSTHKQARNEIQKFYQTPGSILIGTEMGLLYLSDAIENIAVVSLDSLFSVPDFSINEKIINILTSLRLLAQKTFIVQTRNAEQPILHHGLSGNLIEFYREEIAARKQFSYPPFTVLIKITRQGKQHSVERDMEWLQQQLGPENASIYPGSPTIVKGKYVSNALLKVPRKRWVDRDLLSFLRSLPPQFIVRVNPESVL